MFTGSIKNKLNTIFVTQSPWVIFCQVLAAGYSSQERINSSRFTGKKKHERSLAKEMSLEYHYINEKNLTKNRRQTLVFHATLLNMLMFVLTKSSNQKNLHKKHRKLKKRSLLLQVQGHHSHAKLRASYCHGGMPIHSGSADLGSVYF